ncbi:MAG: MMPL family transporter [Gammaproteobacteria bacterium]|nr:MMPL family transporter [Gammaproteobacteria bacterium]
MTAEQSDTTRSWLITQRGKLLLLSLVLGIVCGTGILSTSFNTSVGELLSESDPYVDELEDMEQRFPSGLSATFALTNANSAGSVFNQSLLAALRELESRYQELAGATRLSSILGYRSPQRNFVLFERPSEQYSAAELEQLHELALQDPLLAGTFLSEQANLTFATVFFEMEDRDQAARLQLADQIGTLLTSLRSAHPATDIYVNSDVLFEQSTQDAMIDDLTTLLPIVILICVLTICYCFHSITFGACILSQALLSIICTIGVIGYTAIGFNTISVIAPLVVVIISVAHSVHIISVYKQQLFKGSGYEQAMDLSIRYNLKPVLLATVTTGIGFMSLNLSSSPAIQDFGRIVALGIGFAFVFTFTLLPALLIWVSVKTRAHGKTMDAVLPYRLIRRVIPFWQRHDKPLFVVCTGLAVLTLLLLPLNDTDFDRLDFIETDSEVGKYYDIVSRGLQRGPTLTYGLQATEEGGAIEPEFLRQMETFSAWLVEQPEIDNAGSLVEVVKTIHMARGGQDPDYYTIPDDVFAIANDLGIYQDIEFPDFPLANFIDADYSTIRLVINALPLSNEELIELDARITTQFQQTIDNAELIHGSAIVLFARMDSLVTRELLQGYSLSLLLITLTLVVGFRSLYFGLLSVIPNLLPATMVFGAWGLFVGQLDPFVMMLFSISIGLVVDDTVHLLTHYLHGREQGLSITTSFNHSLDTAGPALIATTAVLALGVTILIGASTLYFQQSAKLLVPIVVLALVLDLIYLPTILQRFDRQKLLQRSG